MDKIHSELIPEYFDYFLRLVLTHETVIYEYAGETLGFSKVHERRANRAVYAAA